MNYRGLLVCVLFTIVAGSSLMHANEGGARRMKDEVNVGDVIAADQKWYNSDDSVVLKINKVNKANSTFAGTYGIIRSSDETAKFPFRGEYDPKGITLGWVVSYWSASGCENDHAVGVWAGYLKLGNDRVPKWTFSTTRLIAHEENYNTTTGYDTFTLEEDDHGIV